MNILILPDDCLAEIFVRIPLVDQIRHLQLVCRRWSVAYQLACRLTKSLALIGCHFDLDFPSLKEVNYRHDSYFFAQTHGDVISRAPLRNHLKLRTNECFTRDVCTRLLSKLPNISRLELIHIQFPKQIHQVIQLLAGLENKLIDLKVFYAQQRRGSNWNMLKYNKQANNCVYRLLNQLHPTTQPLLRCCTLDIYCRGMYEKPTRYTINLNHLTQLHLTNDLANVNMIRTIFNQNSTFESLQKLTLESVSNFPLEQIARKIFARLTHLTINSAISRYIDSKMCLKLVNEHCSEHLRYLHVTSFRDSLQYLAHCLRKTATHLVHLRVDFAYTKFFNENPVLNSFWDDPIFESDDWSPWHSPSLVPEDFSNLPIFASVTTLHLRSSGLLHTNRITSACSVLAHLFPNLASLVLSPFDNLRYNFALCKNESSQTANHTTSKLCKNKMVQLLLNGNEKLESIAVH